MKRCIVSLVAVIYIVVSLCGCTVNSGGTKTESSASKTQQVSNTVECPSDTASGEVETSTTEFETDDLKVDLYESDLSKLDSINLAVGSTIDINNLLGINNLMLATNSSCIRVDNGSITGVTSGKASVTIDNSSNKAEFSVCITDPKLTQTEIVKVACSSASVSVLGTTGQVEWYSDNEAIATVNDGIITAESTGCGMNTKIHAIVDGKDLACDVTVEPIPQIHSMYKLYSESNVRSITAGNYDVQAEISSNTNTIIKLESVDQLQDKSALENVKFEDVLKLSDVNYTDGLVLPVFDTYMEPGESSGYSHSEIYILGSSQNANVLAKPAYGYELDCKYENEDGYGVLNIYAKYGDKSSRSELVGIIQCEIDGLRYDVAVRSRSRGPIKQEMIPDSDIVESFVVNNLDQSQDSGVNSNYSDMVSMSCTFIPNDFVERVGEKFVEAVEDKAISICVDLLFAAVFHI